MKSGTLDKQMVNITELTLEQLKSAAFDLIIRRDEINNQINLLLVEINKRQKELKNDNPN